jgi:membrane protease subunit HflC
LLLILIFGLLLFTFQVRTTEVAVVTTFGNPTRPITEPNLYFKWPWPIQKVWSFDRRVQNFEDRLTEGLTPDGFALLTSVYVGWKVSNPTNFFPRFAGSANPIAAAETLLDQWLGNAKTAVVGRHPLSDFVSTSDNGAAFLAIENEILARIQSQIQTNNLGLEVQFLGIKRLQLPESVSQSVFDRMTSERKLLADRFQYEGEAEAQRIRSGSDRRATELLANAEAQATQIKGKGEAEAAKSLAVFQQNPGLASFIFRLSALEGSLKERSILIFDQHTPPFDLFWSVSTNLLNK